MLLKTLLAKRIEPQGLITHRFKFDRILEAYETSGHAAHTHALNVTIEAWEPV